MGASEEGLGRRGKKKRGEATLLNFQGCQPLGTKKKSPQFAICGKEKPLGTKES